MKLTFKRLIVLLTAIVIFCTACKKSNDSPKPVSQTLSVSMISGQIALNLAQSLSGAYGGINLKSGINKPAFATIGNAPRRGVKNNFNPLNSQNALCSFLADSVVSYDTAIDTIKSHTGGSFNFYFNCNNGVSTGYTAADSLTTTGTAPSYSFLFVVVQNYQIASLNAANSLLSVNGNLKSLVDLTYNNTAIKPTVVHDYYVLTGLTVDLTNNGDITSGTATFTSTGSNNYGPWNYSGSIVFLGNHMANIIINGTTYHANLLTGVIS
jgi:hypothetical protein